MVKLEEKPIADHHFQHPKPLVNVIGQMEVSCPANLTHLICNSSFHVIYARVSGQCSHVIFMYHTYEQTYFCDISSSGQALAVLNCSSC